MQDAQDSGSIDAWRVAQLRRAEDLTRWFRSTRKQDGKSPVRQHPLSRSAVVRSLTVVTAACLVLASVSAVVHEGKSSKFTPKATTPLPAVNAP
jgi:hypothetical protein